MTAKFDLIGTVIEPMLADSVEATKSGGAMEADIPVAGGILENEAVISEQPVSQTVWAANGAALRGLLIEARERSTHPIDDYKIAGIPIMMDNSLPDDVVELRHNDGRPHVRQSIPDGDHMDMWRELGAPGSKATQAFAKA